MKVASFFSGCGGADLGLIQAGHEIVFATDNNIYCKKSYDANFNLPLTLQDFNTIDPTTIPEADIYVGGPPCQDYSLAGSMAGVEGSRGILIKKFVELIEIKRPKWVIIENVKGLICKKHRPAFQDIITKITSLSYTVSWKVLNSKDFGVPQNRNRVFIIAGPTDFTFPEGFCLTKCLFDVMDKEVDARYYVPDDAQITLKGKNGKVGFIGSSGSIGQGGLLNRIYDGNSIAPTTITSGGSGGGAKTGLYKIGYNKIDSITGRIYDGYGVSMAVCAGGNPSYFTKKIRRLTPRECARLQGFPEEYKQVVSNTQFYKQAGNAITVSVMKAIGDNIK
jgi:DNA (cytosine-5)-methyltransferase 1